MLIYVRGSLNTRINGSAIVLSHKCEDRVAAIEVHSKLIYVAALLPLDLSETACQKEGKAAREPQLFRCNRTGLKSCWWL